MQEKMKVLALLEDGKISTQEAIELLNALNLNNFCKEKIFNASDFDEKMKEFGKNVEQFVKEMGDKINGTAKIVEPKIKNATKSVLEKTAYLIDELAKTLTTTDECDCKDEKETLENENFDDETPREN